jgi:hypothetical protein
MHAHLFLGHQAALGALNKVRQISGNRPVSDDTPGHTSSVNGALASCYYSLSKIAPSGYGRNFLARAEGYVELGLNNEPETARPGLLALRGSIRLRQRAVSNAIRDYKEALTYTERQPGMEARGGELLAELGWAELQRGHLIAGVHHLREGVRIMVEYDHRPGFIVRGRTKLGCAFLARGQVVQSLRELLAARQLAIEHQLQDQLKLPLRVAGKIDDILDTVGVRLTERDEHCPH